MTNHGSNGEFPTFRSLLLSLTPTDADTPAKPPSATVEALAADLCDYITTALEHEHREQVKARALAVHQATAAALQRPAIRFRLHQHHLAPQAPTKAPRAIPVAHVATLIAAPRPGPGISPVAA